MSRRTAIFLVLLSAVLFICALITPAFSYHEIGHDAALQCPGWEAFSFGPFQALLGFVLLIGHPTMLMEVIGVVGWTANPLLVVSWIALIAGRRKLSIVTSIAALGFTLGFLTVRTLSNGEGSMDNISPGIGYCFWVLSIVVTLIGGLFRAYLDKKIPARIAN
ncbi:hypothetical protein AAKU55_005588 [Oxalobacteraceae bacterium GrIS 1.11]